MTNVLVLEMNTLKEYVETSTPHNYTCRYHQFSSRASLEIITHRQSPLKTAVATLSYSPVSTLHPQVIYAIAFSAGLNDLQVDYVDKENDK